MTTDIQTKIEKITRGTTEMNPVGELVAENISLPATIGKEVEHEWNAYDKTY